jgi:hypothetical protein
VRSPRVRAMTFTSYTCHIYATGFGQYWTSFCHANSSTLHTPICDFCSSGRGFASGFLQIPSRDGHPCLQLTVPTAKPVADFHRQVIAHAGRTSKNSTVSRMGNCAVRMFLASRKHCLPRPYMRYTDVGVNGEKRIYNSLSL